MITSLRERWGPQGPKSYDKREWINSSKEGFCQLTDLCLVKHLGEFESAEVGYAKKKKGGAQLLLTEKGVGVGRENQGRRSQREPYGETSERKLLWWQCYWSQKIPNVFLYLTSLDVTHKASVKTRKERKIAWSNGLSVIISEASVFCLQLTWDQDVVNTLGWGGWLTSECSFLIKVCIYDILAERQETWGGRRRP